MTILEKTVKQQELFAQIHRIDQAHILIVRAKVNYGSDADNEHYEIVFDQLQMLRDKYRQELNELQKN